VRARCRGLVMTWRASYVRGSLIQRLGPAEWQLREVTVLGIQRKAFARLLDGVRVPPL
jgi:hypothetical protein